MALIFQLFVKPLLQFFNECILLLNAPVNLVHADVPWWFDVLQRFGDQGRVFFLADGWLFRPLLLKKFLSLFHRCHIDGVVLLIKNQGVFRFTIATAKVVCCEERADCRVVNKG